MEIPKVSIRKKWVYSIEGAPTIFDKQLRFIFWFCFFCAKKVCKNLVYLSELGDLAISELGKNLRVPTSGIYVYEEKVSGGLQILPAQIALIAWDQRSLKITFFNKFCLHNILCTVGTCTSSSDSMRSMFTKN